MSMTNRERKIVLFVGIWAEEGELLLKLKNSIRYN